MKYNFDIEYIHDSFIKAHPSMHENHPDFIAATSRTNLEVEYSTDPGLDQAKQNIQAALEVDGCHLLKISGGPVG